MTAVLKLRSCWVGGSMSLGHPCYFGSDGREEVGLDFKRNDVGRFDLGFLISNLVNTT